MTKWQEKRTDGSILISSPESYGLVTLLPAFLLAQGSVKGKNDISLAQLLEAEFRVRNSLEGLSFAFP